MDAANSITIIGILLNILTLVIGGVWAVSKIGRQTDVLDANIAHLSSAIDRLAHVVGKLDGRVDDHERRLTILETRGDAASHHHHHGE